MADAAVSKTDAHANSDMDRCGRMMAILLASLAILAAGLASLETAFDIHSRVML
ncbi:MAG: hypothetical protein JW900_04625 [Anaerolineae bacterium]|nr:hypothetical protein [Anaerolineae bacterium]